jgi:hypothetical protein
VSALESRKPGGGDGGGGPTEQDFESLSDRILALESRLESSSPGGADTGALEARLVALEAKLDAVSWRAEGGLEARVVALEGKAANGGGGAAPAPAAGGEPGPSNDKLDALEKKVDVLMKLAAKVAELESQVELLANAGPGERGNAPPPPPTGRFKLGPAELKELTLDLTKTSEWKGLMDGQFRMMMKHLEGEVIPRVVKKHLEDK